MFGTETIEINYKAGSAEDVLVHLGSCLNINGFVGDTYIKAVIEREQNYPTGLPSPGVPIAIPHTDPEHVYKSRIAVATLSEPVSFSMMGNPEIKLPVKIVFMLAIKDPKEQPNVLKQFMKVLQNKKLLHQIVEAREKDQIQKLLSHHIKISLEDYL